jgi:hypothetical protein
VTGQYFVPVVVSVRTLALVAVAFAASTSLGRIRPVLDIKRLSGDLKVGVGRGNAAVPAFLRGVCAKQRVSKIKPIWVAIRR